MRLSALIEGIPGARLEAPGEVEVLGIQHDSRRVRPGDLFVCIRGFRADGHAFVAGAATAGAVGFVVQADAPEAPAAGTQRERAGAHPLGPRPLVRVPDTRAALGPLAARFYGDPSGAMAVVGVTGTNGKTTTTYLVEAILREAGRRVGLIGTVEYRCGDVTFEGERTTPEASDLQSILARMRALGAEAAVLEVSSHSLVLHRIDACRFDVGVFTNLTQDHLDFHGTMEAYAAAKALLFRRLGGPGGKPAATAVINRDDPWADRMRAATAARVLTFSASGSADVILEEASLTFEGIRGRARTPGGTFEVASPLVGRHNACNILAAVGACVSLGIPPEAVARGIASLRRVPGRFEKVEAGQPFGVIVDYAHTPDALERVLEVGRQLARARLIAVFGCGGDRDATKRPLMGEIATRLADFTVITSDNPRGEDPEAIIAAVEAGAKKPWGAGGRHVTIPDRREAIRAATRAAREGDMVVIAGKGHETYQVIGDRVLPFDDRVVAREALLELGYGKT